MSRHLVGTVADARPVVDPEAGSAPAPWSPAARSPIDGTVAAIHDSQPTGRDALIPDMTSGGRKTFRSCGADPRRGPGKRRLLQRRTHVITGSELATHAGDTAM